MKKVIIALVFALAFVVFSQAIAKEKPRIGILRFTNTTNGAGLRDGTFKICSLQNSPA